MIKKILLANLGNRNITFKGQDFDYIKKNTDKTFLQWSKELLDDYDKHKNHLDINIINPLIEQRPAKIFLFYSDQRKFDTKINQDTIYEALIIEKILIDKYGFEKNQISLEAIDSKVIDNGNLLKYFRSVLKRISNRFKNDFFIICDAGGTAQQKMALKLMAEFIFTKGKYEIKYTEKNELVTDVNVDEYRKIINQEQAIKLIHSGEYVAAANLLDFHDLDQASKDKDKIKKLFAYCYFRFYNHDKISIGLANNIKSHHQILNDDKKKIPLTKNTDLIDFFKYEDLRGILDLFFKAKFYYLLGNYSASILNFSRFYEKLFNKYMDKIFNRQKYGNTKHHTEIQKRNFERDVEKKYKEVIQKCRKRYDTPEKKIFRIEINSLPSQAIIIKNSPNKTLSKIGKILSPHIIYTDDAVENKENLLNLVRNKIAHEGRFITESNIKNELSFYPGLLKNIENELELKTGNLFEELNVYLENQIRQN